MACNSTTKISEVSSLPYLPIGATETVKGVSAPFIGIINDELWVAGGCNFPVPTTEGGKKTFYNDVYRLDKSTNKWTLQGQLPQALAYGAFVNWNNSVIFIGGQHAEGSSNKVYLIESKTEGMQISNLPNLPVTADNTIATIVNDVLYVAGGIMDGKPSNRLFSLNLIKQDQWVELKSFPGASRIQPCLVGLGNALYLIGGFEAATTEQACELPIAILKYNITQNAWHDFAELPTNIRGEIPAMVGAFAVPVHSDAILIGGGVNRSIFEYAVNLTYLKAIETDETKLQEYSDYQKNYLKHSVDWYQFNDELYLLNVSDKTWSLAGVNKGWAKAGAGAIFMNDTLFVVGGELKPGIRTDEVIGTFFEL